MDPLFENIKFYSQVEEWEHPLDVLGLSDGATVEDIKAAYKTIALRLHPDKCPEELRELHTLLFQTVHRAYTKVMEDGVTGDGIATDKEVAESWEALHARNLDFKEKLRKEREQTQAAKKKRPNIEKIRRQKWAKNGTKRGPPIEPTDADIAGYHYD